MCMRAKWEIVDLSNYFETYARNRRPRLLYRCRRAVFVVCRVSIDAWVPTATITKRKKMNVLTYLYRINAQFIVIIDIFSSFNFVKKKKTTTLFESKSPPPHHSVTRDFRRDNSDDSGMIGRRHWILQCFYGHLRRP